MGVGNAELISSMIEDEKGRAELYLKTLTDKMKDNHVRKSCCRLYVSYLNLAQSFDIV